MSVAGASLTALTSINVRRSWRANRGWVIGNSTPSWDLPGGAARWVSMVDRCSKIVRLALVPSCKADGVAQAIASALGEHKDKVLTLTMDNGLEFARHRSFGKTLQADTYFAKPYQSWQRGLNEHSNGLVRQYFPKATDFSTLSERDVRHVEALLNNRPRAVLGFQTPLEVFHSVQAAPLVALMS